MMFRLASTTSVRTRPCLMAVPPGWRAESPGPRGGCARRRCWAAAQVSAQTGRRADGFACDVTDEAGVDGLVDRVLGRHGRLDVLVTSAGIQARGTIDELDVATLRACLDTNIV